MSFGAQFELIGLLVANNNLSGDRAPVNSSPGGLWAPLLPCCLSPRLAFNSSRQARQHRMHRSPVTRTVVSGTFTPETTSICPDSQAQYHPGPTTPVRSLSCSLATLASAAWCAARWPQRSMHNMHSRRSRRFSRWLHNGCAAVLSQADKPKPPACAHVQVPPTPVVIRYANNNQQVVALLPFATLAGCLMTQVLVSSQR